ncbi:hypothetical protein GCM10009853_066150 [Glycomyces scopariae]
MNLDIKVLDRISVEIEGREVRFGDRKQRIVLAVLALNHSWVSKDLLVQRLWESEQEPKDTDTQIYGYINALRKAFEEAHPGSGALIVTERGRGYALKAGAMSVDYRRFKKDAEHAASAEPGDLETAVRFGRRALAEWGAPAGLRGCPPLEIRESQLLGLAEGMRQEHETALLACLQAEMQRGMHKHLISELATLAGYDADSAANEELARIRMLAHHRSGENATALDVYDRLALTLSARFDSTPQKRTTDLKFQIYNNDPALQLPGAADEPAASKAVSDESAAPADETVSENEPATEGAKPEPHAQPVFNNLNFGTNAVSNQGYIQHIYGREARGQSD